VSATDGFRNHPLLELREPHQRERLLSALAELDRELALEVPVVVAGRWRRGELTESSTDPCLPERVVANWREASDEEIGAAVAAAERASWPSVPAEERAAALERAAERLDRERLRFASLILREAGKPWPEADAELCEAIDFLRFYALASRELGEELLQVPGERNVLRPIPRGPTAVISPWNFPLSISCGMVSAALVTGNPVLYKPAEQTPATGAALVDALLRAGIPDDALHLLPGAADVGRRLVAAPEVATIAFTGSVEVGLDIHRRAYEAPEQRQVKRVVAELGGKNCVIVDADADLDESVPEIVASAYAYAGQKCSAAARVLVHEALADRLRERLAGAVELLRVGPAEDFATDVPALIDDDAVAKYHGYAELSRGNQLARAPVRSGSPTGYPKPPGGPGSTAGSPAASGAGRGRFVSPLLVADLPTDSPVLREEVFGPLLTVEAVRDLDEAAARVRALPQALTGGIFSRQPEHVERLVAALPTGNLYVNRHITGAVVARQPFGGNGLSGTGARTGSRRYLWHFADDQVVSENTLRHGLELS
jgi:RHH-type transcriptional regulator, proline utilization regulon repressor / proline dehydrogenase / delta 1-pyrroline-5-carboxylate dehydrogenase